MEALLIFLTIVAIPFVVVGAFIACLTVKDEYKRIIFNGGRNTVPVYANDEDDLSHKYLNKVIEEANKKVFLGIITWVLSKCSARLYEIQINKISVGYRYCLNFMGFDLMIYETDNPVIRLIDRNLNCVDLEHAVYYNIFYEAHSIMSTVDKNVGAKTKLKG